MCKLTLVSSTLFGMVICVNGYSVDEEECIAVKNSTIGKLQCPDDKSIVIEKIGFANDNCSSNAFLNPQNLSLLHHITCTRSTCTLPFNDTKNNFLNIGFKCKECVSVKDNRDYTLNCTQNHWIEIDNVLNHSEICPAYDIFKAKKFQRNKIKSFISKRCNGKQTCEISNEHSNDTQSIYFHCEVASNTTDNDMDSKINTLDHGSNPRNHTPNYNNGNGNQTLDQDNDKRTHTTDHDNGDHTTNQYHSDNVFQAKENLCPVCSTKEKCLTVQTDTERNITCSHEQGINISMAWVDKVDCNNIGFIAKNIVELTGNVSSLCSGNSNCSLSFHSPAAVFGVLNVLYYCKDGRLSSDHINNNSKEQIIGGAIAGGVTGVLIAFLLLGVFMIRRCRNKNDQESNAKKMDKTRSNPKYDPNELQVDQEINHQSTYSATSPHNTVLYSRDTNYDHLQSKEGQGNNYTDGRDTNYTYMKDFSTYDHIQSKDNMTNTQTKTLETDVYSHLKDGVAVSDAIYDHTLRDGIRDTGEGYYDVSHGIMTDDDYDVSGNLNRSQVEKSDSLYN